MGQLQDSCMDGIAEICIKLISYDGLLGLG